MELLTSVTHNSERSRRPRESHNLLRQLQRKRQIIICDIPSLAIEQGLDFDRNGMQNKLRGLAEKYKDDDWQYIVSVLTTNDLNSATIKDISELMYQMKV